MNNILIGRHINISKGFTTTADYANQQQSNVFQIFLKSPQSIKAKSNIENNEYITLSNKIIQYNQKMMIHGSYVLNFCHQHDSQLHLSAIDNLVNDLNDSVKLGAIGVIVHMGHNTGKLTVEEATNNFASGIRSALNKTKDSTIIFETGAGQGKEICTSLFDLGELRRKFTQSEKLRIKFCIDTCHIFAAGYDLGNIHYVSMLNELIETCLGWDNIIAVHLNDSKCALNSRKDRHADIGAGMIKLEGFKKFIKICAWRKIPMCLETPCDTINHVDQITLVKSYISEE